MSGPKLTAEEVVEIRILWRNKGWNAPSGISYSKIIKEGLTYSDIGDMYDCSWATIKSIIVGKSWNRPLMGAVRKL